MEGRICVFGNILNLRCQFPSSWIFCVHALESYRKQRKMSYLVHFIHLLNFKHSINSPNVTLNSQITNMPHITCLKTEVQLAWKDVNCLVFVFHTLPMVPSMGLYSVMNSSRKTLKVLTHTFTGDSLQSLCSRRMVFSRMCSNSACRSLYRILLPSSIW